VVVRNRPEPSDDGYHVVRRLEAFSDIVIGFSLAQTALNLFVPQHPGDFLTRPVSIIGFVFTFAVIAGFWWTHSSIFRHFFVPNRLMISLNFIALALIVLQVFTLQMWLHFGHDRSDGMAAARIYFGVFGLTQLVLAALSGVGVRFRRLELSPAIQLAGIQRTIGVACRAIGVLIGVAYTSKVVGSVSVTGAGSGEQWTLALPSQIFLGLIAGAIVGRIINGVVSRRWKLAS